jgi:hypothetical protein
MVFGHVWTWFLDVVFGFDAWDMGLVRKISHRLDLPSPLPLSPRGARGSDVTSGSLWGMSRILGVGTLGVIMHQIAHVCLHNLSVFYRAIEALRNGDENEPVGGRRAGQLYLNGHDPPLSFRIIHDLPLSLCERLRMRTKMAKVGVGN